MTIVNDREWKFLSEQTGMSAPFNDMYFHYLRDLGYKGTLSDMIADSGFGLIPSEHFVPSGPIIENGTFDTDTVWTKGTGWTITGGAAVGIPDAMVSDLSQPADIVPGTYQVEFDVVTRSAGAVSARFDGGTPVAGPTMNAVGHYNQSLISNGNTIFSIRKTTTFNGSIDNVVVTYLGLGG